MGLSVVGQPGETMLTTVAAVKDELGIEGPSRAQDVYLERLIRDASQEAVRFCRRPFARQRVRETGLEYRDGYVMVTLTPVAEVHTLALDGQVVLGVEIEDADTGVLTGSGNALLGLGEARWWNDPFRALAPAGSRAVVEYTGGFVVPADEDAETPRTLPYDVEAAVIGMVKAAYQDRGDGPEPTVKSVKVEDVTYQYETGAPASLGPTPYERLERWVRVV